MADYQLLQGGGVLRTADKAIIPEDTANKDWREYQEWLATPANDPDSASSTDLEAAQQRARRRVEIKSRQARLAAIGTPEENELHFAAMRETILQQSGTITADADLPILSARITVTLNTVAKVAGDVLAADLTQRTALATADTTRLTDLAAIEAATTPAEADAVAP